MELGNVSKRQQPDQTADYGKTCNAWSYISLLLCQLN